MTATKERRVFEITLWYFKPGGKFYAEGKAEWEFEDIGHEGKHYPQCYMYEVVDHVRGLRERREPMPGLIGSWDGFILVNCEHGYPCLIKPIEEEQP